MSAMASRRGGGKCSITSAAGCKHAQWLLVVALNAGTARLLMPIECESTSLGRLLKLVHRPNSHAS